MKARIVMIIRRLYSAYALLEFFEQDDAVPATLRVLLVGKGALAIAAHLGNIVW